MYHFEDIFWVQKITSLLGVHIKKYLATSAAKKRMFKHKLTMYNSTIQTDLSDAPECDIAGADDLWTGATHL